MLEKHSRAYVFSRVRAGVLEQTMVDVLKENGLGNRMESNSHMHDGMKIFRAGRAGLVIDDRRLPQPLGKFVTECASSLIACVARGNPPT